MKRTDTHNPFLAFMPDAELVRKTTEAWAKAMPTLAQVQQNPIAATINSSVASFEAYSTLLGYSVANGMASTAKENPAEGAVEPETKVSPQTASQAPSVPVQPAKIEKPEMPSDLKAISGVGPKLESVLNGIGIWAYDQIAAWSQAEIKWLDDFLQFGGRIERDNWVEQAKVLAGK